MSPPSLYMEPIRILTAIFKTPAWHRLYKGFRSVTLLLSRLFFRALYRCLVFLRYRRPKQSPRQDGKGLTTLEPDESSISPHSGLTYTSICDGSIIPLNGISMSWYHSSGGSIGSASQIATHSWPGTPNGRLTPSDRSVASVSDRPYSTSHSRANSVHSSSQPWPADQEAPQIKRGDYGPSGPAPQDQDSESPTPTSEYFTPNGSTSKYLTSNGSTSEYLTLHGSTSEYLTSNGSTSEYLTPNGSTAEAEFDSDINSDPIYIDDPGASATPSLSQSLSGPSSMASNSSTSWEDGWDLNPTFPSESLRMRQDSDIILKPLDFSFETFSVPDGWTRHAHPEGGCYFYNESKRLYTDTEIYDPAQFKRIEERVKKVEMAKMVLGFPDNAEIVLNIYKDEEGLDPQDRQYFCLDHDRRVIFFFHEFHVNWIATWSQVGGAFSKNHLRYELESQYWYAVQMYPHRLKPSKDMVDEVRDIVLHLIGDTMFSDYSTSEFTLENLQKILSVTSNVKENIGSEHTSGTMCLLARFMFMLYHSRFLNFHGESYARLERNFSVYGHALYHRTHFLRILSFLLFSAPDVYRKNLQKLWVDKVLKKAVWEETSKRFSMEWQELVTAAAILLNANIAFLSIQSVDQSPPARSLAQIISYASVFTNIGGIFLGLLLIRQYRDSSQDLSDHIHGFLQEHDSSFLGLEALAVMFSLPYALLMWGSISFLAAFALMCLDKAEADTRITIGICLTFTGLLISWFILVGWETNEEDISMKHRTWAYYPPRADETDASAHVSSPAEDTTAPSISPQSEEDPPWPADVSIAVRTG